MKTARVLLALPGLAALAWGVVLFAEYALPLRPDVFGTVGWIIGGPILNDAVIAPLTALLGIVLSRVLPHPWKTPVVAGTVITGVLAILAFPLFWRPYGTAPMPGLHDTNPAPALALTLATVWLAVLLTALRHRLIPRPTRVAPPITRADPPITRDASPITRDTPPGTQDAPPSTPTDPPGTPTDPPETPADPPGTPADLPGTPADRPGP
ncbi:hypothetical protein [Amycolatopsis sp. NPDC051716]|uniref:hypothetical protein n=1 Tax=Amycolatopsis sp. NPDC051716 TaxID=3155804 RepID=UPI00342433FE